MRRPCHGNTNFMLVAVLSSFLTNAGVGLAETVKGPENAKGLSDTPYEGGPPPVTDGYTDTSQGGTKTSGDAPIPPPSKEGKVESLEGTLEGEAPAAPRSKQTP